MDESSQPASHKKALAGYVNLFLDALRIEKNYSPHTCRAYRHNVTEFIRLAADMRGCRPVQLNPDQIDRLIIRQYLAQLHEINGKRTVARKLAALRTFFDFLTRRQVMGLNPARAAHVPKQPKPMAPCLTIDDIFRLIQAATTDGVLGKRNLAMVETMYSAGIRVSELVGLNIEDLDLTGRAMHVRGKGRKQRMVPIGRQAVKTLQDYLAARPALAQLQSENQALFLNKNGGRLSTRSVGRMVTQLMHRVGLTAPVSPHQFRHAFATHMIDNGCDLRVVQEILGHASLSTTQKYTHVSLDRLMEVYDQAHPRR
jgi:integrase/recombinase XerC